MLRLGLLVAGIATVLCAAPPAFRSQEIGNGLGVVYAVTTADVNGDGKPDIVAITGTQLLWFENPGWTKHVVAEKVTAEERTSAVRFHQQFDTGFFLGFAAEDLRDDAPAQGAAGLDRAGPGQRP